MERRECQLVVFSDKAYNAIVRETFEWEPVETGGILLGHVLDNGCWIVMEVLPPGYGEGREGDNVFHEYAYFEYNKKFVNYLAKSVAEQYETPLELLGLWHRHPGSMDHFSGTDDETNLVYATQNDYGVISGLVNVDPNFRITMYYLSHADSVEEMHGGLNYKRVEVEVGSDLIPEDYFRLKYYNGGERGLHPSPPEKRNEPENGNLRNRNISTDRSIPIYKDRWIFRKNRRNKDVLKKLIAGVSVIAIVCCAIYVGKGVFSVISDYNIRIEKKEMATQQKAKVNHPKRCTLKNLENEKKK